MANLKHGKNYKKNRRRRILRRYRRTSEFQQYQYTTGELLGKARVEKMQINFDDTTKNFIVGRGEGKTLSFEQLAKGCTDAGYIVNYCRHKSSRFLLACRGVEGMIPSLKEAKKMIQFRYRVNFRQLAELPWDEFRAQAELAVEKEIFANPSKVEPWLQNLSENLLSSLLREYDAFAKRWCNERGWTAAWYLRSLPFQIKRSVETFLTASCGEKVKLNTLKEVKYAIAGIKVAACKGKIERELALDVLKALSISERLFLSPDEMRKNLYGIFKPEMPKKLRPDHGALRAVRVSQESQNPFEGMTASADAFNHLTVYFGYENGEQGKAIEVFADDIRKVEEDFQISLDEKTKLILESKDPIVVFRIHAPTANPEDKRCVKFYDRKEELICRLALNDEKLETALSIAFEKGISGETFADICKGKPTKLVKHQTTMRILAMAKSVQAENISPEPQKK